MTSEEYYARLREHGFSVQGKISVGETTTLLLQGREPGELPTIMAPESQNSEQRIETMAIFLRNYAL